MWIKLFKVSGFLLLFIIISSEIKGSHLIGGEINYRCLGNDQYEVSFTLIRDCFYGQVAYDDPATIAIFGSNNQLDTLVGEKGRLYMELNEVTRIDPEIDDDCIELPEDLCVQTTTYRDTIELPFKEGGYLLVYQSCCRNRALVNVLFAGSTGVTYTARITEKSLIECNSAATFKNWPPILICINQPIHFDHSAIDIEGDSLVYRLCEPLRGATPANPNPDPPLPPPYPRIRWDIPDFSFHNKLGGTDTLKIDSQTGILTGTPTINGPFIVGVCVEEYRNGELISTTNRDFQYNVGDCRRCYADFFVPKYFCDQLEVTFENLSKGCIDYKWFFGGLEDPLATSTEIDPTYTFPDFGTYDITLVSFDESPKCNDTITQTIHLLDEPFDVDIKVERGECLDTLPLSLIAVIESDNLMEFNYLWEVEWGGQKVTSTDSIFNIDVFGVESIHISLRVINPEFNCWKTVSLEYETGLILVDGLHLNDFICNGDTINLFPNGPANHDYHWSPAAEIIGPADVPSPLVSPEQQTLYAAQLSNQNCSGEISILVGVYNPETLQIITDTICGTRTVTFDVNPFVGFASSSSWRFFQDGDLIGFSRQDFPTFTFPEYGNFEVILNPRNFDFDGCSDTVRQNIYLFDWDFELNLDIERKSCIDSLQLCLRAFAQNGEIEGSHSFQWVINSDTLNNSTSEVDHFVSGIDSLYISVLVYNDFGCSLGRDTVIASGLLTDIPIRDTIVICKGDTLRLEVPFAEEYSYVWEPDQFFITPNNIHNPKVIPESDIIYSVLVEGADCKATFSMEVELFNIELDIPEFILCNQLVVQLAVDTLDATDYFWIVFRGTDTVYTGTEVSPVIEFDDYGSYSVILMLHDIISGCRDTLRSEVQLLNSESWSVSIDVNRNECEFNKVKLGLGALLEGELPDGEFSFAWKISGDTVINLTGDSIELDLTGVENLEIELTVTDSFGCSHSQTIEFNYNIFEFTARDTISMCEGDTVLLNPDFHSDYDYIWSPATGLLDGVTHSNPAASPASTILYTANIFNGSCTGEKEVLVIVNENPVIVSLTAEPANVLPDEGSMLFVEFQPPGAEILWSPAESLDNPNIHNPVATPLETTTYVIAVTSEEGCTTVDSITVFVQDLPCENPYVFLPNAFSPNGDGMNDVLYVLGDHIEQFVLIIYNRWGQEVFRTVELDRGWNGQFRGEDLPPDVYGYYLEVECIGGAYFSDKGNVSLIR